MTIRSASPCATRATRFHPCRLPPAPSYHCHNQAPLWYRPQQRHSASCHHWPSRNPQPHPARRNSLPASAPCPHHRHSPKPRLPPLALFPRLLPLRQPLRPPNTPHHLPHLHHLPRSPAPARASPRACMESALRRPRSRPRKRRRAPSCARPARCARATRRRACR